MHEYAGVEIERRCQARMELLDRDGNRNSFSLMPMTTA
jgi:hypothetical protein